MALLIEINISSFTLRIKSFGAILVGLILIVEACVDIGKKLVSADANSHVPSSGTKL